MKSIAFLLAVAAIITAAGLPAVQAQADVSLVLTKQTPFPVEPGQVVTIEASMQNNGSGADPFTLEIVPKEPFTLLPGQDITKSFSRIDAYDSVTHSYKLKVAEDAVSASYDMEFRYYITGQPSTYISKKLPITVQGTPKFVIGDVVTDPESMEPGDHVTLNFKIKNTGSGKAYQTEASLEAECDSETGVPLIVPALSGGNSYLGEMESGEEKDALFMLEIDNEAEYKSYTSTLTISYKDENGESQSTDFTIGLPVRGSPVIEVLSAKMDNGDFKVDVENIGTGTAKALKIALIQDGEIRDSSVANELKPTRHKTLRFRGFSLGNAIVNISYLDQSNDFFVTEIPVTIKRSSYSDEESSGGVSPLSGVLALIVIGEGYYIWRLRKKLKRMKKR